MIFAISYVSLFYDTFLRFRVQQLNVRCAGCVILDMLCIIPFKMDYVRRSRNSVLNGLLSRARNSLGHNWPLQCAQYITFKAQHPKGEKSQGMGVVFSLSCKPFFWKTCTYNRTEYECRIRKFSNSSSHRCSQNWRVKRIDTISPHYYLCM